MTLFTVVISFVGFLPFLFYGGAYLLTKRQERNHGILNDEDPLLSSSAPSVSSTAAAATNFSTPSSTTIRNAAPQIAEEAATNFSPVITTKLKSGKLFNKFQEPDDSSDEENLAKKN